MFATTQTAPLGAQLSPSAPGMPRRCRDQAIRGMVPRRLFANVAAALSSAADSFPLPMPPSDRRMGGLAACMAVHAFTQARHVSPVACSRLAVGCSI